MNAQRNQNQQGGFAAGYIDVATRIAEFRSKHPDGCLRPVNPDQPVTIVTVGDKTYLQYVAAAYRTPADPCPGIGVAWEVFPGRTPFTRDSEAMVAETSAWGRAIVAVLAADTRAGIASSEEIKAARARRSDTPADEPTVERRPARSPLTTAIKDAAADLASDAQVKKIGVLRRELGLDDAAYRDRLGRLYGVPSAKDLTVAQASDLIEKLTAAAQKKSAA